MEPNLISCPWCTEFQPVPDTQENRVRLVHHQRDEHPREIGQLSPADTGRMALPVTAFTGR